MRVTIKTHLPNQDRSSYCPEKAELVKAKPMDVQIVCNSYNVDAIPEDQTDEWERVLDVHKIVQHSGYSPGTEKDIGRHKKGPFNGYDISIYHVKDDDLWLNESRLWPACLPRLEEETHSGRSDSEVTSSDENKTFFAGWMDPEPSYRSLGAERVANGIIDYFYPRKIQAQKVNCSDPAWMSSNTYYPPATICYKDPSESSCFQNGNSGSSVMTHFQQFDDDGTNFTDAYAFTGPLSMHKGCDQVST